MMDTVRTKARKARRWYFHASPFVLLAMVILLIIEMVKR